MKIQKRLSNHRFLQLVVLEDNLSAKAVQCKTASKNLLKIKNIAGALNYKKRSTRYSDIAFQLRIRIKAGA